MYSSFYGFREKPFSMTPDTSFLFLSKNHQEAFAHLLYGINSQGGFIELAGEVGSGKTTVLRTLMNQLDREKYTTALIFNPCLSALELLQSISKEYGLPADEMMNARLIGTLNEFLLKENAAGRTVVLVVDEAQNLSPAVLEQIRLISNLETEKSKLIQILLAGQPELETILNRPEMRQIRQRITVQYYLKPMDYDDTVAYINHRIGAAGGDGRVVFAKSALKRIFHYSRGLPRLINIACDRALLAGYTKNAFVISGRMAALAINDLNSMSKRWWPMKRSIPAGLILIALLCGAGIYLYAGNVIDRIVSEDARLSAATRKITMNVLPTGTAIGLEEFAAGARAELTKSGRKENIAAVFNAVAPLLGISPLSGGEEVSSLDQVFRDREVQLYRYQGNLGGLLRLNRPAVLEINIQGLKDARYIALTGQNDNRLLIGPPVLGKSPLTAQELETLWTGRSYIPWKNVHKIPIIGKIGTQGEGIKRLQVLLQDAHVYRGNLSGVFDKETKEAVRKFQLAQGIDPDGIAGSQTLFQLYCTLDSGAVRLPGKKSP